MDNGSDTNYRPGGHAEQLRNSLWGREEPRGTSIRSLDEAALLSADLDINAATQSVETEPQPAPANSEGGDSSDESSSSGRELLSDN